MERPKINYTNAPKHWSRPDVKRERLDINVLKEAQAQLESLAKLEIKEMLERLDQEAEHPNNEI